MVSRSRSRIWLLLACACSGSNSQRASLLCSGCKGRRSSSSGPAVTVRSHSSFAVCVRARVCQPCALSCVTIRRGAVCGASLVSRPRVCWACQRYSSRVAAIVLPQQHGKQLTARPKRKCELFIPWGLLAVLQQCVSPFSACTFGGNERAKKVCVCV